MHIPSLAGLFDWSTALPKLTTLFINIRLLLSRAFVTRSVDLQPLPSLQNASNEVHLLYPLLNVVARFWAFNLGTLLGLDKESSKAIQTLYFPASFHPLTRLGSQTYSLNSVAAWTSMM